MTTETLPDVIPDETAKELAEVERTALRPHLADAIRGGAKLVKGQLRRGWVKGDMACAFGAAALWCKKEGL